MYVFFVFDLRGEHNGIVGELGLVDKVGLVAEPRLLLLDHLGHSLDIALVQVAVLVVVLVEQVERLPDQLDGLAELLEGERSLLALSVALAQRLAKALSFFVVVVD